MMEAAAVMQSSFFCLKTIKMYSNIWIIYKCVVYL